MQFVQEGKNQQNTFFINVVFFKHIILIQKNRLVIILILNNCQSTQLLNQNLLNVRLS